MNAIIQKPTITLNMTRLLLTMISVSILWGCHPENGENGKRPHGRGAADPSQESVTQLANLPSSAPALRSI